MSITGSSSLGTTTVKNAFENIFARLELNPIMIQGDSFHRFERVEMRQRIDRAEREGRNFSHFSADANDLEALEELFKQYGEEGSGKFRRYLHTIEDGKAFDQQPGTFTPWHTIPEHTDLLFYEGLHGAVVTKNVDIAKQVDLLIGVVPIINLEWLQKIHRDTAERDVKPEDVTHAIMRRMHDYINIVTPQFSKTDINFQRVPTVDTSDPFRTQTVPDPDETLVVIHFREPRKFNTDFPYLLSMLQNSFMSRRDTIVVPGGKMGLAMEIIFMPIIEKLMSQRGYKKYITH